MVQCELAVAAVSVSEQSVDACDLVECDELAIALSDATPPFELSSTRGLATGVVSIPLVREAWVGFSKRRPQQIPSSTTPAPEPKGPLGGSLKRALDIFVAGLAILLLSPLLALIALLIGMTMGRPIVFSHTRLGYGGRRFACMKFRTMVKDGDTVLEKHLINDPAARAEWQRDRKLRDDPRVTRLGRLLRRSSIDELPQLFNVLLGDMSCVGPRPIVEDEAARYGRAKADYLATRPGMTGLWQISGRNRLSYRRRVALDRRYVRQWSIWEDLRILLYTIPAVLRADDTA